MKAWVITVTSLEAAKKGLGTKVIALLSARKTSDYIKQYIEQLYTLTYLDLSDQKAAAKYTNPASLPKVVNNHNFDISCISHPYIFRGQLSNILDLSEQNGVHWLKWQGVSYQRYTTDPNTHAIIDLGQEVPKVMEAPQAKLRVDDMFA